MPERWTRERRVEHTRNLLLDAAEKAFAERGLGGAALEDIADAAGYTRGAIYAHFGSKEELFLAVIERQRQRFLDGFADVLVVSPTQRPEPRRALPAVAGTDERRCRAGGRPRLRIDPVSGAPSRGP